MAASALSLRAARAPLRPAAPAAPLRRCAARRAARRAPLTLTRASLAPGVSLGVATNAKVDAILARIAGTDSGADATPETRRAILDLATELEADYALTGVRCGDAAAAGGAPGGGGVQRWVGTRQRSPGARRRLRAS
jgi:hypothetical protein